MKRAAGRSAPAPVPVGARPTPEGVDYRVWAPDQSLVCVRVDREGESREFPLQREDEGYWRGLDPTGRPGDRYRFRLADGGLRPDVASRFQPQGVFGPSECIDPGAYRWRAEGWTRPGWTGQTIYEIHLGALTPAGTYRAATEWLGRIRELGAEALELMPLADFAGRRNWGYDGVALYAPARCYGRPDELRGLVDAAHACGLAVILDVVYNHVGPAGSCLSDYCADYFRSGEGTAWGAAFNLDGERSRPVRDFLVGNAAYWLDEFRFDGLRLDATHAIADKSPTHLLAEIAAAARARGAFVIAEDERNETEILQRPDGTGYGFDAAWADDFHHEVRVGLTGAGESYFSGYSGTAGELAGTLARGWTYCGQPYGPWGGRPRGAPCTHLPERAFVVCIENHDQIGNRARGERLEHLVSARQFRAASLLLCLSPYPPLLFMGQEWAAGTPFLYFTDHGGELGRRISAGRQREFEGAGWPADAELPDPEAPATFAASKLRWQEREEPAHAATLALYREALAQRRRWLRRADLRREHWSVAAIGQWIAIRYRLGGAELMLLAALRPGTLATSPWPDPLAPARGRVWRVLLDSEAAALRRRGRPRGLGARAARRTRPPSGWSRPRSRPAMPLAESARVPVCTYRVQLQARFNFRDLEALAPYFEALGVSDFYLSPIFTATPGSSHGYDLTDYREVNPELGGREAFAALAGRLRGEGRGLILDFVPNHMGIAGLCNRWWRDVLENGQLSPYAPFFDIQWNGAGRGDHPRVLVPVLADHYGKVLERGGIALAYGDEFSLRCGELALPLRPSSWAWILEPLAAPETAGASAIAGIIAGIEALPRPADRPDPEAARRRAAAVGRLKQELAAALAQRPPLRARLAERIAQLNGVPGEPRSFDQLHALIERQNYRLARWQTGAHEINYRRFFAIDSLVGLRMERPEVFRACHELLAALIGEGLAAGLRIDHIDGLRQPEDYLRRLQALPRPDPAKPLYVLVEKILAPGERLPDAWPVHGTTGYEFIPQLAAIFVAAGAAQRFDEIYRRFTGESRPYRELVYEAKKAIIGQLFINAASSLGAELGEILSEDRRWRDLTRHELTTAVIELMACLPVYRTYRRRLGPASDPDRQVLAAACAEALARNPREDPQPFEFVRDLLIGSYPDPAAPEAYRTELLEWVLTFQQYTGAVTAKAVEDTAFYVFNRLIALNEVGCDPGGFGGSAEDFHRANAARLARSPQALLATSTHDTKLSEDVRARLYALSELPDEWEGWLRDWSERTARHTSIVGGQPAPDALDLYRFFQVLLGAWPLDPAEVDAALRARLRDHFRKAVSEAKRHTSFLQANDAYFQACDRFVDAATSPATGADFLAAFLPAAQRIARLGLVNSLAQLVLKCTVPGVPDFYQGSELWDFSLVDPDNRREVDYGRRRQVLAAAAGSPAAALLENWRDGGIKLRVMQRLLQLRARRPRLFSRGDYRPVAGEGTFAGQLIAFTRHDADAALLVVVPRLSAKLGSPPSAWPGTTPAWRWRPARPAGATFSPTGSFRRPSPCSCARSWPSFPSPCSSGPKPPPSPASRGHENRGLRPDRRHPHRRACRPERLDRLALPAALRLRRLLGRAPRDGGQRLLENRADERRGPNQPVVPAGPP